MRTRNSTRATQKAIQKPDGASKESTPNRRALRNRGSASKESIPNRRAIRNRGGASKESIPNRRAIQKAIQNPDGASKESSPNRRAIREAIENTDGASKESTPNRRAIQNPDGASKESTPNRRAVQEAFQNPDGASNESTPNRQAIQEAIQNPDGASKESTSNRQAIQNPDGASKESTPNRQEAIQNPDGASKESTLNRRAIQEAIQNPDGASKESAPNQRFMSSSSEDTPILHEQKTITGEVNRQVGAKKTIEFNHHGEAVGPNATHFKARVGKFVKKFVPISHTTWKKVPTNYKDDVWNEIVREFEVPSYLRKDVEKSMPTAYRRLKHSLRKHHLDKHPNLEARKSNIPTGIEKEDWEKFCINESNEKQMKIRAQAIQTRKKSKYGHTGGRRSAAMIENEMIAEGNHAITRTDVWLAAHTRKDGTVLSSAAPFVEKVKAKFDELKRNGGSNNVRLLSINEDPLAQVFGKRTKCLPGVGSYVSKSKYDAALHPHIIHSGERRERVLLEKRLDKMQKQLDFVLDYVKSHMARGTSTPTPTLVVDDESSALNPPSTSATNRSKSSARTVTEKHLLGQENSAKSTSAESKARVKMCELLDWNRNCVAVAKEVTDPAHRAICHNYHLKTEYEVKVSLCKRKHLDATLYKETPDAKRIKEVGVGDFLVWPKSHVNFLE